MKKHIKEPLEGVLATKMDVGTKGFDDFQTIILNKSKQRTENQRRKIELLAIRYRMEDYISSEKKDIRPAGHFLRSILSILHIQQNMFADYIGIRPSNFSKILNGERSINYDLALILGRLFNHDPLLWIDLQAKYEISKLEHSDKNKYSEYSLNDIINKHKNAG